jgi:hypothetical protein
MGEIIAARDPWKYGAIEKKALRLVKAEALRRPGEPEAWAAWRDKRSRRHRRISSQVANGRATYDWAHLLPPRPEERFQVWHPYVDRRQAPAPRGLTLFEVED